MPQTIALLDLIPEFPEPFQDPETPPPAPQPSVAIAAPVVPVQAKSIGEICLEAIAIIESRNPALLEAIVPLLKALSEGEQYDVISVPKTITPGVDLSLDETYAREYDPTCPGGLCPITGNN
ncbi:MAG: hypothetical protein ACRCYP_04910 [Alphaproteobacteria bacterium]